MSEAFKSAYENACDHEQEGLTVDEERILESHFPHLAKYFRNADHSANTKLFLPRNFVAEWNYRKKTAVSQSEEVLNYGDLADEEVDIDVKHLGTPTVEKLVDSYVQ